MQTSNRNGQLSFSDRLGFGKMKGGLDPHSLGKAEADSPGLTFFKVGKRPINLGANLQDFTWRAGSRVDS